MTSALRRLAGPSLDCGDVQLTGADFICAADPAAGSCDYGLFLNNTRTVLSQSLNTKRSYF